MSNVTIDGVSYTLKRAKALKLKIPKDVVKKKVTPTKSHQDKTSESMNKK